MKKTARAHTNIALIKYWGKANSALKTPLMSSLSMTLDAFYTDTTFNHDSSLIEDTFILNGKKQTPEASKRVFNYIHLLQDRFGFNDHFTIESTNHVPTSAGLASSASAFSALATSFAASYDLDLSKKNFQDWLDWVLVQQLDQFMGALLNGKKEMMMQVLMLFQLMNILILIFHF